MQVFVISHALGFLVMDKSGRVLRTFAFSSDPADVAEAHFRVRRGEMMEQIKALGEYLRSNDDISLITPDCPKIKGLLGEIGKKVSVNPSNPMAKAARKNSMECARNLGWEEGEEQYHDFLMEVGVELSRRLIREELKGRDRLIIRAVEYLDDLNKSQNILIPAIREWYLVHFPEMDQIVDDHYDFASIVSGFAGRGGISLDEMLKAGIDKRVAEKVAEEAANSMGADLADGDIAILRDVAERWMRLQDTRKQVEKYMKTLIEESAPNLGAVVGPLLAARLIAMAGGLWRLAKMPASTVQILGARKAIFLHMTRGAKPPKHGLLFQMREVRSAPIKMRGKISRIIATKVSIAARVDAFSGQYIGDKLKEEIRGRIAETRRTRA